LRHCFAANEPLLKRYPGNPIVRRDAVPCANSIFNSAVVPYEGEYRGVFRVDDQCRHFGLRAGRSTDGLDWDIDPEPISWKVSDPRVATFDWTYDPRITPIDGRYYVTWCHTCHGPSIGLGVTDDFESFEFLDVVLPPFNRNAVLFPRRIGGQYMMLHRPSDNGHTPFGDIFVSSSPDLLHWGRHRFVMGVRDGWQSTKIGAGPVPIETPEGWVLIYHGVLTSCNGFVYSVGAAILDPDDPTRVLHRTRRYILAPTEVYECVGDVPNVTFPCAALHDEGTGEVRVYYGGADTCVCLATCSMADLLAFIKGNRFDD
jgi:beta-1,4-mannooligosaccharide/beta-1,4-mannosyl-N-acetylglucosamine phosphorylase